MSIEQGLRIANENLAAELRRMKREGKRADRWCAAWTKVIGDIGELIQRARGRPKGRRFVTILELQALLTRQRDNDDD